MNKRLQYFNELQIMRNGMEHVIATNGSVELDTEQLTVGQRCTIRITYVVGQDPIYPGGVIRFTIPFGFTKPQIDEPTKPGYTTVLSQQPGITVRTKIVENDWWKRGPDRTKEENVSEHVGTHIWVEVTGNTLTSGDKITLVYGDTTYSSSATAYACLTTGYVQFDVATDQKGWLEAPYSGYYLTENPPVIMVNPAETAAFEVILPSELTPGEEIPIHFFAIDAYNNLNYQHVGDVELYINEEFDSTVTMAKSDCGVISLNKQLPDRIDQSIVLMKVVDKVLLARGESNPAVVKSNPSKYTKYWGDPHGHSGIQWGRGSGRSYYEYAKEVAALDFCALTDPDAGRYTNNNATAKNSISTYMSDEQWDLIKRINQEFYSPGEFVPILGYEYHNDAPNPEFGGDRNVYFDNYEQYILRCIDEGSYTPAQLWETMREQKINAITIPHHTAKKVMLGSWEVHDDQFNRLVEIYSGWGNSEGEGCERPIIGGSVYENHSVQHALNKGYRLGFVAGSDTHAGNPGYSHWVFSQHENGYRGGLTCVLATDLTLPAVFEALKERRTYATTGERIILNFSLNGHQMGSDIPLKEHQTRELSIEALGTNPIAKVEIISMGKVIHTVKGSGRTLKVKWIDDSFLEDGWTYYYVRVTQVDRAIAWSSPIWVS